MPGPLAPHLLVPDWPAPAAVRAVCTTRHGGVSAPPFDTLNLGDHVRDDPAAVAINRQRLGDALAPARPVFLRQVHGTEVLTLDAATPDGAEADACVTTARAVACTIMVADCLPVLFARRDGLAVGAAHAGWRGLAAGVLEATARSLQSLGGAGEWVAWLGPCIGPTAFEVGPDVVQAMEAADPGASACFNPHAEGKWLADLPALARRRLLAAGAASVHGNDGTPAWCTVTQASRFFSHRRDAARLGSTGRLAACVWLA